MTLARNRLNSLLLLAVSLLFACAGQALTDGSSAVQFPDIPVPDGMRLDPSAVNHSYAVGEFRHGDFRYEGKVPIAEVASYMTRRMVLHGWQADSDLTTDGPKRQLVFRRQPHVATCDISQVDSLTRMTVAVRTAVQ
jgi:hypothetical protein